MTSGVALLRTSGIDGGGTLSPTQVVPGRVVMGKALPYSQHQGLDHLHLWQQGQLYCAYFV